LEPPPEILIGRVHPAKAPEIAIIIKMQIITIDMRLF
jgi:hypothetical protein